MHVPNSFHAEIFNQVAKKTTDDDAGFFTGRIGEGKTIKPSQVLTAVRTITIRSECS